MISEGGSAVSTVARMVSQCVLPERFVDLMNRFDDGVEAVSPSVVFGVYFQEVFT